MDISMMKMALVISMALILCSSCVEEEYQGEEKSSLGFEANVAEGSSATTSCESACLRLSECGWASPDEEIRVNTDPSKPNLLRPFSVCVQACEDNHYDLDCVDTVPCDSIHECQIDYQTNNDGEAGYSD